jgi:hypothetical protein
MADHEAKCPWVRRHDARRFGLSACILRVHLDNRCPLDRAEILDILRLKKLHSPGSRLRAVVSAEAVEDSDDMDDDED